MRGRDGYHSGKRPARAAWDSGEPPSDSVRTVGCVTRRRPRSLVIRLSPTDRPGAVQLLGEDEPCQLVGQRPGRECDAFGRLVARRGAQTVGAADENSDVACAFLEPLQPGRELLR